MEALHFGDGVFLFACAIEGDGGGFDRIPLDAQRLDDGRDDEALDVGPRGVVGAELVALDGIEGALQQRAEDRGLDVAPVGARGFAEELELVFGERERVGFGEEAAVEFEDVRVEGVGKAAAVRARPELLDFRDERVEPTAPAFEELAEALGAALRRAGVLPSGDECRYVELFHFGQNRQL